MTRATRIGTTTGLVLGGLLLAAGAGADPDKDESGRRDRSRDWSWEQVERERGERWVPPDGRVVVGEARSRWDAAGSVSTRRGAVDVRVYGGRESYRDRRWDDRRRDDRRRYDRRHDHRGCDGRHDHCRHAACGDHRGGPWYDGGRHQSFNVPPGHLPPPGRCKVWFPDRPPGHQGPPLDCRTAEREAYYTGGFVVYGAPRGRH